MLEDFQITAQYVPEIGDDLITTICLLLMLFWGSLGDLELVRREDRVAGVGAATDLAAVIAVAEDLNVF